MSLTQQLQTLEGADLIRLAMARPELAYMFRHALVHEAAYASLVRADRRRLHAMVGECLERLAGGGDATPEAAALEAAGRQVAQAIADELPETAWREGFLRQVEVWEQKTR